GRLKLPASLHTLALTTQGYHKLVRLFYSNELLITTETDRDIKATVNRKRPGPKWFLRLWAEDRLGPRRRRPGLKSPKADAFSSGAMTVCLNSTRIGYFAPHDRYRRADALRRARSRP
ncbi:MAG: hypothetical protein ABW197_06755, partial [Methyloceanibacter sp.]